MELYRMYGGPKDFTERFPAAIQWKLREVGADYASCSRMNYPTMWEVREAYGVDVLQTWVAVMIENLNDFCNVKDKMKPDQKEEAAHIIGCDYGHLNIAEVALFFLKVKSGAFGEFYGILDTVRLMSIMRKFIAERTKVLVAYEEYMAKQDEKEKREKWSEEAASPEQIRQWIKEGRFKNLFRKDSFNVINQDYEK